MTARCYGAQVKPGQGGEGEEQMIRQAIRNLRDKYGLDTNHNNNNNNNNNSVPVVAQVMNAMHAQLSEQLFPAKFLFSSNHNNNSNNNNTPLQLKILTRADMVRGPALLYQMHAIGGATTGTGTGTTMHNSTGSSRQIPVVALDLSGAEKLKIKQLKPLLQILAGATEVSNALRQQSSNTNTNNDHVGNNNDIVVCGLPNAGKSSLILGLTKHRTMAVRKKQKFHLPKVSATAGWTLGTKAHLVEHPKKGRGENLRLIDTPGLRPPIQSQSLSDTAHLLAMASMETTAGMLKQQDGDNSMRDAILDILWKGLKRHAQISSLSFPYEAADDLWQAHQTKNAQVRGDALLLKHLIYTCVRGGTTDDHQPYGGLIIEQQQQQQQQQQLQNQKAPMDIQQMQEVVLGSNNNVQLGEGVPVVAMNKAALVLRQIGAGERTVDNDILMQFGGSPSPPERKIPFLSILNKPPSSRTTTTTRHSPSQAAPDVTTNDKRPGERIKYPKVDEDGKDIIVQLPEYQQKNLRCLKCLGMIKRRKEFILKLKGKNNHPKLEWCGQSYPGVIKFPEEQIKQFYSRVFDAFGGDIWYDRHKAVAFFLRQSCLLTIKRKHNLSSLRKMHMKDPALKKEWYIPNEKRVPPFQNHRPLPFRILCHKRSGNSQAACWRMKEGGTTDVLIFDPKDIPKKKAPNKRSKSTSRKLNEKKGTTQD